MNGEIFTKFAEVKSKISLLQDEENKLKEEIVKELSENNVKTAETNIGKFTVSYLKRYEFSDEFKKAIKPQEDKIKEVKKEIKSLENKEIESGKAKETITNSLRFTPKNA